MCKDPSMRYVISCVFVSLLVLFAGPVSASPPSANCPGQGNYDPSSSLTTGVMRPDSFSVNDGDEFTSSRDVRLLIVGPNLWKGATTGAASNAEVSNDGGFKESKFFKLDDGLGRADWTLQSNREGTFTKIVYVRFWNCYGNPVATPAVLTDDIILDNTLPTITTVTAESVATTRKVLALGTNLIQQKKQGVRLQVSARDSISGPSLIQLRQSKVAQVKVVEFNGPYGPAALNPTQLKKSVNISLGSKQFDIRIVDRAGNASRWRRVLVN